MPDKMNSQAMINSIAEFSDSSMEELYSGRARDPSDVSIRSIALYISVVYMLASAFDFYNGAPGFASILASRCIVLAFALFIFFYLAKDRGVKVSGVCISVFELILFASYMVVINEQRFQGFSGHIIAVIIFILGIFLIPNRFINCVAVSILSFIIFVLMALAFGPELQVTALIQALGYFIIVVVLSAYGMYKSETSRRLLFAKERQYDDISSLDLRTNIFNRSRFDRILDSWCTSPELQNFSVMLFCFDNFRDVNDQYGHLTGDKILIDAVGAIKDSIRDEDVFARWGGVEFIILFPMTSGETALSLAERTRSLIQARGFEGSQLTCSFGVTQYYGGDSANSVIKRAGRNLNEAKLGGRNMVVGDNAVPVSSVEESVEK